MIKLGDFTLGGLVPGEGFRCKISEEESRVGNPASKYIWQRRSRGEGTGFIMGGSMRLWRSLPVETALVLALLLFSALGAAAQAPNVRARVTEAVDELNLVTLRGNIHPLARPEYDRGAAPDSQSVARMLLVLQRGSEQEAALRQLLDQQQIKSSPNYHQWLTPEQFGQQFGPADSDIQAVTDWLTTQGFQVDRVAAGRTVIEFSGTAGLVRQALHTEIHRYVVNGEEHWANASNPQVPAALVPVVAGIALLTQLPPEAAVPSPGRLCAVESHG